MSRFQNPWPHDEHGILDIIRWKLKWGPQETAMMPDAPDGPAEWQVVAAEELASPTADGWRLTWLGHASFLLQGGGFSILIDPIFSKFCAPLPMPGLRRLVALPCAVADLPVIDAVLLTHGHYDHLDLPTLRSLGMDMRMVIAEGHADWLGRKGFKNVSELRWGERLEIFPGLTVTGTPAQHFTARTPWDRNKGHWCGWLIEGLGCKLWHAGDSGYCPAFAEIGEKYGPIDFGMIPIGAYQPQRIMKAMHLTPEEAVKVFQETRCRRAVAMHWGTFRLTDEPAGEPPLRLAEALRRNGIAPGLFAAAAVGTQWAVPAGSNS